MNNNNIRDKKIDLLELAARRICPWCGKKIPENKGIGTGKYSDGIFCDLDCYAHFFSQENYNVNQVD